MTWGRQNTEAEGHAQLDAALEQGVNFVDSAEMYSVPFTMETLGETERIIGTWLEKQEREKTSSLPLKSQVREEGFLRIFDPIWILVRSL